MTAISLSDYIQCLLKNEFEEESAKSFLLKGSQDFLLLLTSILLADTVLVKEKIPSNLSGNFYLAFQKPSLGKLQNFIYWLASNSNNGNNQLLKSYLLNSERKKRGWISKLVEIRNAYAHPKNMTKEEVLEKAIIHLSDIPDYSELGIIEIDKTVCWISNDLKIDLFPFAVEKNGEINTLSEINLPDIMKFPPGCENAENDLKKLWDNLKYYDKELSQPSPTDLLMKIKKKYGDNTYTGEAPKWLEEFLSFTSIGMLICPGIANGILANLGMIKRNPAVIDLLPESEESPMERLKTDLELFLAPEMSLIDELSSRERPVLIIIRADHLSSESFLQAIYMIADLYESNKKTSLKFLIERSGENLRMDQDTLWDDLPDDMDKLFKKFTRKNSYDLFDYLWESKQQKILGIF